MPCCWRVDRAVDLEYLHQKLQNQQLLLVESTVLLISRLATVSGSDSKESPLTKKLESEGAIIHYGQCAENISDGIDCVVYTAAINKANPELMEAVARKIPMLTRAELLGQLMKNYKTPIGCK